MAAELGVVIQAVGTALEKAEKDERGRQQASHRKALEDSMAAVSHQLISSSTSKEDKGKAAFCKIKAGIKGGEGLVLKVL